MNGDSGVERRALNLNGYDPIAFLSIITTPLLIVQIKFRNGRLSSVIFFLTPYSPFLSLFLILLFLYINPPQKRKEDHSFLTLFFFLLYTLPSLVFFLLLLLPPSLLSQ